MGHRGIYRFGLLERLQRSSCPNSLLGHPSTSLKRQITVVANIYPRILWTPPSTDYISVAQRKWTKAVHLAEKLLGMATNSECSPSTAWTSIVQRQWRETRHPDLFYLGYGAENNVLHYKWHLGLIGADVSLYRLPEGQDKPRVGEWVHLAGTYNGQTGKMSLYVNGELIGTADARRRNSARSRKFESAARDWSRTKRV